MKILSSHSKKEQLDGIKDNKEGGLIKFDVRPMKVSLKESTKREPSRKKELSLMKNQPCVKNSGKDTPLPFKATLLAF